MLTARSVPGSVCTVVRSLHSSPPAGIVTVRRPPNVTSRVLRTAAPPVLRATVVRSMVNGRVPNVFCTRIRTALPPWLRCVIIRIDRSCRVTGARCCCDCAHEVNQRGRSAAAVGVRSAPTARTVDKIAGILIPGFLSLRDDHVTSRNRPVRLR
jgi:hypothetical protein